MWSLSDFGFLSLFRLQSIWSYYKTHEEIKNEWEQHDQTFSESRFNENKLPNKFDENLPTMRRNQFLFYSSFQENPIPNNSKLKYFLDELVDMLIIIDLSRRENHQQRNNSDRVLANKPPWLVMNKLTWIVQRGNDKKIDDWERIHFLFFPHQDHQSMNRHFHHRQQF